MKVKPKVKTWFWFSFQLLPIFMQLGSRELMMFYIDLKQTNDVLLTFEALKVKFLKILGHLSILLRWMCLCALVYSISGFYCSGLSLARCVKIVK